MGAGVKITDLRAKFVRYETRNEGIPGVKPEGGDWGSPHPHDVMVTVPDLASAQGLMMLCPACLQKNGGPVGTHSIAVTFRDRGVADHQGSQSRNGRPSRWAVSGTSLEDLTTSPSIDCGCWHGFITNGDAT